MLKNTGSGQQIFNAAKVALKSIKSSDGTITLSSTVDEIDALANITIVYNDSDIQVVESPNGTFTLKIFGSSASSTNIAINRGAWSPGSLTNNTFIGNDSGNGCNRSACTYVGNGAGSGTVYNAGTTGLAGMIAIGYQCLKSATSIGASQGGVFIGSSCCTSATAISNNMVFIGNNAGNTAAFLSSTGQYVNAIGAGACRGNIRGNNMVIFGANASSTGDHYGNSVIIGTSAAAAGHAANCTVLGHYACRVNVPSAGAIVIGNQACETSTAPADSICIGNGVVAPSSACLALGNSLLAPTATATAGAATLPANPVSFMPIFYNGTQYRIPLYNV